MRVSDNETTTMLAVGERDGRVVLQFPHAVRECIIDPETARQAGEAIARSAYTAHYGTPPPAARSAISAAKRVHLKARATLIVRSLTEAHKSAGYIADHVVDMLLTEL